MSKNEINKPMRKFEKLNKTYGQFLNENEETIKKFSPPYDRNIVENMLWYFLSYL